MNKSRIFLILLLSLVLFLLSSQVAPMASAQSVDSGTISGVAWVDANSNGIQEPAEETASTVTIELRAQDGALVRTTVTNAAGEYIFTGLAFGIYHLNGIDNDGAVTAEQTVELNEINGVVSANIPLKAQVMKYQFLPLVRR